jgi:tetratricopeptide (TPR) repeat protein
VLQLIGGSGNRAELSEAYTCLGEVELALGKTEKAKKRFNKALEIQENDVRALRGAAQVLFQREEWSTLLNHYNNIIYHAKKPGYVIEAYLTKGFVLDVHMNLADKAAQHYEKSLTFDPGQLQALLRLGELAIRRDDFASAASLAERGLAVEADDKPTKAMLRLVKAIAAQATGDAALAAQAFGAAQEDAAVQGAVEGMEISDHAQVAKALNTMLQAF